MSQEIPKQYDPSGIEEEIYRLWLDADAFAADPDGRDGRYVIMMPLPNVTGALHMGHAMDNVMQDLLIRWHRMRGENSLWMAGTDHAGIATQAVVEKRLFELEGKTRHELGREAIVERIWAWKDQYQKRIVEQQQAMGCSCDWRRQRFTMDRVCARAVYWTFFKMFRDGLIYRGNRLVNWDCHLQTAVSDDEIVHETVNGHFWHLRYPVIDPRPGEPQHIVVATTRPETMLGDTAVACHPDPSGALKERIAETREKLERAPRRERAAVDEEIARLEARRASHLPTLDRLIEMARDGRRVMLPLLERPMPLIADDWAKPELGSGCVKITPGHDPNDYEVWRRHEGEIDIINILNPDGTLNGNAGPYAGLDRIAARDRVVEDLEARGLLEAVEERQIEIGHSDRSRSPIEPYLSKQWFVRTEDIPGGVLFGRGTAAEFTAPGLAQAAIEAASGEWSSHSGRRLAFHPDPVRYGNTYRTWLAEKRDWCISRQLWWGHRIPIWAGRFSGDELRERITAILAAASPERLCVRLVDKDGASQRIVGPGDLPPLDPGEEHELLACLREPGSEESAARALEENGLERDPDVLDTWFSSGIWPHSTLGWPDPQSAAVEDGQAPLGAGEGGEDCLAYYYPGSCLVTGRDIITLWVARMVMMGLYNIGDLPFTDVFIHANILDGNGERMSKSKGNGIDPVDIIARYGADAMRYVLAEMQTGTQDIRLPVQAISPFTGDIVDLATAKHGSSIFTYLCPKTGKEFDVLGTMPEIPSAKLLSERFEVGRNFCNKLWNAVRFALPNLEEAGEEGFRPLDRAQLADEDRWILSRLSRCVAEVNDDLEAYNPSAAISSIREFFWGELCDWYLELIKPRLREEGRAPVARRVLAAVIDPVLRLLHPFIPFVSEALWRRLNERAPERGVDRILPAPEILAVAPWPEVESHRQDDGLEERFRLLQEAVRAIREVRSRHNVPPSRRLEARVRAGGESAAILRALRSLMANMAQLAEVEVAEDAERSADAATAVVRDVEIYLPGAVDIEKEKARLGKQREELLRRLDGSRKKLANESFVTRAKPEVVDRERRLLADLEARLKTVDSSLAAMG